MPPRDARDQLSLSHYRRFVLRAALGVILFITAAFAIPGCRCQPSPSWPSDALQVLATLLIATAIEGRAFDLFASRRRLQRGEGRLLRLVWGLVWLALLVSLVRAWEGKPFARLDGAFVAGAIGGLAVIVLFWAVPPPRAAED